VATPLLAKTAIYRANKKEWARQRVTQLTAERWQQQDGKER
jgi:hypothetical protein